MYFSVIGSVGVNEFAFVFCSPGGSIAAVRIVDETTAPGCDRHTGRLSVETRCKSKIQHTLYAQKRSGHLSGNAASLKLPEQENASTCTFVMN